ncbi:MAG TPA: MTH938/NDUFAF3 family protein [bacterium]|nr:hypothetical protein [Dictyoglomota bacterium]HOK30071.1 MTH938/NDUFAF3 family protein [bacterium]HOL55361.1 MTH938/NDUFAF3 family protein [bacterium]HOP56094.1 MTH938/NDUFAF3 family protein [bacterium]HPO82467.1 MTH938/NDUFAF3 family protein [bacterium]
MNIEHYEFGKITIDGISYFSDIIIYPDHIEDEWWREEGHELHTVDIMEIVETKPKVLIVGTGAYGMLRVLPEAEKYLKDNNIQLIAELTGRAVEIYNQTGDKSKVVCALHLTC